MALREFGSVKVGDELPEKIVKLTRQDLVNYAGVSGDLNPIHWDDEIAKQVGLDTAIAHGMLTMGLGGGFITNWVGDPAAVTEYNVRFTSVVPVPNDGIGAQLLRRHLELVQRDRSGARQLLFIRRRTPTDDVADVREEITEDVCADNRFASHDPEIGADGLAVDAGRGRQSHYVRPASEPATVPV